MQQNIGYFMQLWSVIWVWIQNSGIYRLLRSFYEAISGSWKKSRIASWFRQEHFEGGIQKESLFGKIVGLPFWVLEKLQKKIGSRLALKIEESAILGFAKTYLHHMLAINLRFMGILFFGCGVGTCLGSFVAGTPLDRIWPAFGILGLILSFFNANITDWLKGSVLIKGICYCLGIAPTFQWYEKEKMQTKGRTILAILVGLFSGIIGGLSLPILGFAIPIGIAAVFLVLAQPTVGAFSLVFFAPILPTMAMAGLSILSVFALLIKSIIDPDFRWKYDGLGFLLLSFILIYLFAGITSFAMVKSLSIWAIYAVFMATYFLIVNLIRKPAQLRQILVTFVLSGLLVCLYGIAQYLFGWDTAQAWMDEEMFSDIKMRIYSTLENPNVLGEYILLVLPIAIGLFWIGKNVWQKLTYAAISAVLFVALILTFSRGCWVGLLFAAAIFITFSAGKLWGLGLIALPVLPMVLPESIINRFTSIGDMKDSSTSYRVYIWMGTMAMIRDFWVSGIGMGAEAFKAVYPFYSYNGIVAPHSHNLFLQILVESGVAGIGVFLLIVVFFLKRMMTGYQLGGGKGMPLPTVINALSAGVCGFLLQGMFDNCFYNYRVMLIFWMTLALGMACLHVARNAKKKEEAL